MKPSVVAACGSPWRRMNYCTHANARYAQLWACKNASLYFRWRCVQSNNYHSLSAYSFFYERRDKCGNAAAYSLPGSAGRAKHLHPWLHALRLCATHASLGTAVSTAAPRCRVMHVRAVRVHTFLHRSKCVLNGTLLVAWCALERHGCATADGLVVALPAAHGMPDFVNRGARAFTVA